MANVIHGSERLRTSDHGVTTCERNRMKFVFKERVFQCLVCRREVPYFIRGIGALLHVGFLLF
jgi:hypothetical protein